MKVVQLRWKPLNGSLLDRAVGRRQNRVHADLERFWMGHQDETVGDGYSKMKEDVAFRLEQAEKVGLGFALPSETSDVVRIVRKNEAKLEVENAA